MSNEPNSTDWISAVSSLAAAVIGVMTLLTVYVGAMQILSENRIYRHGLSWMSLGPWQAMVAKRTLFGLQRQISAPRVSIKVLTQMKRGEYEMQDASELVNGIVPMHWTGKDLVSVCSILGFQSHGAKPSFSLPMPLPMRWSGPLGWLQFRASANGCVAEFRRRRELRNQISGDSHDYYKRQPSPPCNPDAFRSRLWNSIGGFALDKSEALYLSGPDGEESEEEDGDEEEPTDEQLSRELASKDMRSPPSAVMHDKMDSSSRKQILWECDGILSTVSHGELAYSRGLSILDCYEYDCKYTMAKKIDKSIYIYHLGDIYMNKKLLGLMKRALLLLRPDGFYFSPTTNLDKDLGQAYKHSEKLSKEREKIFPEAFIEKMAGKKKTPLKQAVSTSSSSPSEELTNKGTNDATKCIANAMDLCNELQEMRKKRVGGFSVDDMQLMAKAAALLLPDPGEQDLVWAILYYPKISADVLKQLKMEDVETFFNIAVIVKDHVVYCGPWVWADGEPTAPDDNTWYRGYYNIPFIADNIFTGKQLVAAITKVFLTYYWIDLRWVTDVVAYDTTMPQSVFMC
ncbi:hypothetical protein F4825DRAFT_477747 [Nemania diffusa]|nr:hypothetical protein F4825DRAFT_477747 [Nemania diffusa]